jgi:hypothetical protein
MRITEISNGKLLCIQVLSMNVKEFGFTVEKSPYLR